MKNRCFYLDREHNLTLREEEVPSRGPEEVVVRILANGICGSDVHFYRDGRLGNFVVTDPYIPGHECAGEVWEMGSAASGLCKGALVVIEPGIPCGRCNLCRSGRYNLCPKVRFLSEPGVNGTLCDYVAVRADMVHRVPQGLEPELAALVEPTAVAVHSVKLVGGVQGKTGAVIGAGPIGLLTAQAFKAAGGGRVICADVNPVRLEAAARLGADEVWDSRKGPLADAADVVFETAGSPAATAGLFTATRPGGTAVQVGWPAGNLVEMNIADLMEKELAYLGVNRYANAYPAALAWLADGRIRGREMITARYSLDQAPEAFAFTASNPDKTIKTIILN